ncbi:hypothetical protein [Methylobacterium sp. ID0610]
MLNAIEQGLSLLSSGARDVRITDVAGRECCPTALYRSLAGQPAIASKAA